MKEIQTNIDFSTLIGHVVSKVSGVEDGSEEVRIHFASMPAVLSMFHSQDCCESVEVYDFVGDPQDLVGSPLVEAEEVESDQSVMPEGEFVPRAVDEFLDYRFSESYTWTFYKFRTAKGCLTLRWLGESNGYYSEFVETRLEIEVDEL